MTKYTLPLLYMYPASPAGRLGSPKKLSFNDLKRHVSELLTNSSVQSKAFKSPSWEGKAKVMRSESPFFHPQFYPIDGATGAAMQSIGRLTGYILLHFDGVNNRTTLDTILKNIDRLNPLFLSLTLEGHGVIAIFYVPALAEASQAVAKDEIKQAQKANKQQQLYSAAYSEVRDAVTAKVAIAKKHLLPAGHFNRIMYLPLFKAAKTHEITEQFEDITNIDLHAKLSSMSSVPASWLRVAGNPDHLMAATQVLHNLSVAGGQLDADAGEIRLACAFFSAFGKDGRDGALQFLKLTPHHYSDQSPFYGEAGTAFIDNTLRSIAGSDAVKTPNYINFRTLVRKCLKHCDPAKVSGLTVAAGEFEGVNITGEERAVMLLTPLDEFLNAFVEVNDIKYDVVREALIIGGKEIDDRIFKSLCLSARNEYSFLYNQSKQGKGSADDIKTYFKSSAIPPYHPLDDLFEVYKYTTTTGALDKLCACLKGPDPMGISVFRLFFLKMVKQIMHGKPNELMPLLIGKQNVGKTGFIKQIYGINGDAPCPPFKKSFQTMSNYFTELDPTDKHKDNSIALVTNFGVLFDELIINKDTPIQFYKRMASKNFIKERRAWGEIVSSKPRRCSIFFTANNRDLLTEPENRRFLPLEIKSIDWEKLNALDMGCVWVDAIKEIKKQKISDNLTLTPPQRMWLTGQSSAYMVQTVEDEFLNFIEVLDKEDTEGGTPITVARLVTLAKEQCALNLRPRLLASKLQESGAIKVKTGRVWAYYLDISEVYKYNSEAMHGAQPF